MTTEVYRLRECFCGEEPKTLDIDMAGAKYTHATCSECGEWSIEFKSRYEKDLAELQRIAAIAWNDAPRANK